MRILDRFVISAQIAWVLLVPAILSAQETEATPEQVRLERLIQELERANTNLQATQEEIERLKRRIEELERAKASIEDASRSIIRQTFAEIGSKINDAVNLGGTLEIKTFREKTFENTTEQGIQLNTAELDFEISVSDWILAGLILEYVDGVDQLLTSTVGDEVAVDRVNIDTAVLTVGDPQQLWPYARFGRMILPFGSSTGDPVTDVQTVEDPLTLEAFETRDDALQLGLQFPTPEPVPATPMLDPPPVKPLVINPLLRAVGRLFGHKPYEGPPPEPSYSIPTAPPPLFDVAVHSFDGVTFDTTTPEGQWIPTRHFGATAGLRARGDCTKDAFCSWSVDASVDFTHSVFNSRFLGFEYRKFLRDIGHVPGMAATLKTGVGPVGVVGEWNAALDEAEFADDTGARRTITPSAWQVGLTYQFGWTPAAVSAGAQGTYVAMGYSETRGLAGVTVLLDGVAERVGSTSQRRLLLGFGEWLTDSFRFAVEYSRNVDYPIAQGGTGRQVYAWTSLLTYQW